MKNKYKYLVILFWFFAAVFSIVKYFYNSNLTGNYKKDILMLLFGITLLIISLDKMYKEYRKK